MCMNENKDELMLNQYLIGDDNTYLSSKLDDINT